MKFDAVYYEPAIFDYPLGRQLREEYGDLPWIPIESHNSIREMQEKPNDQFGHMKRNLIAGIRKTHKYVENHKVSDYLAETAERERLRSGLWRTSSETCNSAAD